MILGAWNDVTINCSISGASCSRTLLRTMNPATHDPQTSCHCDYANPTAIAMASPLPTFSLPFRFLPPPPPLSTAPRPAFVFLPLGLAPPQPSSLPIEPPSTTPRARVWNLNYPPLPRTEISIAPRKPAGPVRYKHTRTSSKFEPYKKEKDARKQVKVQLEEIPRRPKMTTGKRLKPELQGVERGSERPDGGRRKNKQKIGGGGKRWRDIADEYGDVY